jgi:membrane protein YdbS with pleckstrin-like domain
VDPDGAQNQWDGPEVVFSNDVVEPAGLPPVPDEAFEPLHPNYLRLRLAGDAIFAAIVVVVAAVVAVIAPVWWVPVLVAVGLLALTALAAWLQTIEVDRIGYLVREQDFSFRQGVISRSVKTVPFGRVQHVSIDRGPLARRFGLATLEMQTAGDGLTVPGIDSTTAERLKAVVVDRAGVAADQELTES